MLRRVRAAERDSASISLHDLHEALPKKLKDRPHGSRSFSPRQFISGFAPDGVDPGIRRSVATRSDRDGGRREFIHRIRRSTRRDR